MLIQDNRGAHFAKVADENRALVLKFFEQNPSATRKEAASRLGLHVNTVCTHVKAINKGWRPQK